MSVVFVLSLLRARVRIAALAIGFGLFEFVVGLSYASIDQNAIRSLIDSLPPALKALSGSADIASPTGYLGSGYIHPVALTVQGALVISMATAAARDTESGAAELILSRPLAPWRWLLAQTGAVVVGLLIVASGGYVGGLISTLVVDDLGSVGAGALLETSAGGVLVFAAVAGVALLASVACRGGARALGYSAGFVVASYALNYLAQIWTLITPLGRLSVFHYFDAGVVLGRGGLRLPDVLVLTAIAGATAIAAHVMVERRELVR
jgi:hypothetical protein